MSRVIASGLILWLSTWLWPVGLTAQPTTTSGIEVVPGMPPIVDPRNLYSETQAGNLSPAVTNALPRVYVPNLQSHDAYVIDPQARKVVDHFRVGVGPQHVVPSWDLKTLWVTNNAEGRTDDRGCPMSVSGGVQMWRLKDATISVMEGRRGEVRIRYTVARSLTE